ncbi:MAG: branched-chain amino acid ABC transporter substrate-binding protein, partial [Egibacteraceae bacterium]
VMTALAELTNRYGADQLQDPGRVRSLLSDQLGTDAVRCRRELNLVVSAVEARIPAALLDDMPASLDALADRLAAETGLGHTAAYWAVLAWAAPLGYTGRVTRSAPPFVAAETATTTPPKATTPPTASTMARPARAGQRPRGRIVALAALVVLLLTAVGTLLTTRSQPNRAPSPSSTGGGAGGCPEGGLAIGFFGALTGPNSPQLGINVRNGARLAADQYNAANSACKVELVEFDSQGDPAQAPALAQKAAGDARMIAIVGPVFSGESRVASPIFNETGLPIVTPATNPALAQNGWAVFHRAVANDSTQGPAAAKYIQNTLGGRRIAVIDDNSEYGKGIADLVRQNLGGKVMFSNAIDIAAQDYSSTVNGVKGSGADVVFYGGYYVEGGRLLKQLRDAGVTATFVTDDGAKDEQLIAVAGQAAEGVLITCPCASLAHVKDGAKFRNDYKAAFNAEPGTYSTEGYDAANVILQAINAGMTDRQSINDYLKTVNYQGITKQIKFDTKGEVVDQKIYMYQVTNGTIVPLVDRR